MVAVLFLSDGKIGNYSYSSKTSLAQPNKND